LAGCEERRGKEEEERNYLRDEGKGVMATNDERDDGDRRLAKKCSFAFQNVYS
jgi:hypothetical protein